MRLLTLSLLAGALALSSVLLPAGAAETPPSASAGPVTAAELEPLPGAVKRYMAFMGVVGKPRLHAIRTHFTGRFRMGLEGDWQDCDGWTHLSNQRGAFRFFEMHLTFKGWMPLLVHDVYEDGKGSLNARLFHLFPVADDAGPALDEGELVTYLNDAILSAPDLLLGAQSTWREVDAHTFDVSLTDRGLTVTARVSLDDRGAPTDFSTDDRYFIDSTQPNQPPVKTRWSTPVAGWTTVEGRSISLGGKATWHFPDGPFTYGELRLVPGSVAFDPAFER